MGKTEMVFKEDTWGKKSVKEGGRGREESHGKIGSGQEGKKKRGGWSGGGTEIS